MRYMMDLEQFTYLVEQASKNPGVKALNKVSITDGTIDTPDLTLSYRYDTSSGALLFTPTKKHTLAAKVASDVQLEKHIDEVIAEVLNQKRMDDIKAATKPATPVVNK